MFYSREQKQINNLFCIMGFARDRLFVNLLLVVFVILQGCSFAEGNCEQYRTSSSGAIQSPNYPNPYPAGQKCTWTVSVEGSVENIKVSFSAFKLQPKSRNGQCVDYVAIYSLLLNKDAGATIEGKFCGDSLPPSLRIRKSSMTVQFISDSGPEASNSYTGFSLHYEANFEDTSQVSSGTAGIVAAIICAVVFIGVGTLRCIMLQGAGGNNCNAQNAGNTRDREVVGTDESYAYQADFPPSYSTVMTHPERFPTPEASPFTRQRNGIVAEGNSHIPNHDQPERTFTLQSNESESSDDDELNPPPPYPGNVDREHQVGVNVASNDANTTQCGSSSGRPNLGNVIDERRSDETEGTFQVPSVVMIVEDEQRPAATGEGTLCPVVRDNSRDRDVFELSQAGVSFNDNTEEIII